MGFFDIMEKIFMEQQISSLKQEINIPSKLIE